MLPARFWVVTYNCVVLLYSERQYGRKEEVTHFAKHHGQDTGSTNNGSVTVKIYRIITLPISTLQAQLTVASN